MKQDFLGNKISDLCFGSSLPDSLCDILLRPGVHIITLDSVQQRQIHTELCKGERDTTLLLALIDNCDKNEADEK